MLKRYRLALVAVLLMLVIIPVAAAERVDKLPAIKGYTSARFELLDTINGIALFAGKGEMENANRAYYVLKALPIGNEPEETLEVVVYDGTVYTRLNNEAQWYIEAEKVPVGPPSTSGLPETDSGGVPVTKIGTVTVAGNETDQYQIWLNDTNGYLKWDLWVGTKMNYLYQDQVGVTVNDTELGEITLATLARSYDFDAAIKIYPPKGAVPYSADSFATFSRNHRSVNRLLAPLTTGAFRTMAIERLK